MASLLPAASCHTIEAVQALPVDFWLNCESLLQAVWLDVVSLLDVML